MPLPLDVGVRAGIVYLVLVLAVPLQYYMSQQFAVPSGQRDASFRRLMKTVSNLRLQYLSFNSWERWCWSIVSKVDGWRSGKRSLFSLDSEDDMGESPAFDLLRKRNPEGYFGTSTKVRYDRPRDVKFRVGQVIRHKLWGYRGVIIGWDHKAHAPERWLNAMHPPDKMHWRNMPNYAILVDIKDRAPAQMSYVPQENLEVITQVEIEHPNVQNYFDFFDGAQYIMRPAWKYFYPKD